MVFRSWQKVNAACLRAMTQMGDKPTPKMLRVLCGITNRQLSHWKNDPQRVKLYDVFNKYEQRILAVIEKRILYHTNSSQTLAGMFILKTYDASYRLSNALETTPLVLNLDTNTHNKLPPPKPRIVKAQVREK